jgi:hypothetical protein
MEPLCTIGGIVKQCNLYRKSVAVPQKNKK